MPSQPFDTNVAIITGASRGIGEELAYQMAQQGAWLALAARDEAQLASVAKKCDSLGGKALCIPTDVTDPEQCQRLVEQAARAYGQIDTLVNNAGITMWSLFDKVQDLTIFEKLMRINYLGSVYCTYYALPYLKNSRGRLVAISSMTGKTGVPTRSGYAASKHAIVGFFDTLRIELQPYGVSVSIIYPDFVKTGTRTRALGWDGKPIGSSPIHEEKVMTVEECARLALHAIARRQREDIQSTRGKLGQWLKLIAPGMVDRIAQNAIKKGK